MTEKLIFEKVGRDAEAEPPPSLKNRNRKLSKNRNCGCFLCPKALPLFTQPPSHIQLFLDPILVCICEGGEVFGNPRL